MISGSEMPVLHITNGDGAADILKASDIAGDVLPWRDPMHHGPFPAGLPLPECSAIRAEYLAGPYIDAETTARDFCERDQKLQGSDRYGRIILWFEHDLLDQLQILQLLDWFAAAGRDLGQIHILCIDRFDGVEPFRGLGQLNREQMATLLPLARPVTAPMVELSVAGWAAFRSDDPENLLGFLKGDTSALPFLGAALHRHLQEYPDSKTGLTRTEAQILRLIADGTSGPVSIFLKNMDLETVLFIGDWPSFTIIDRLCAAELIKAEAQPFWYGPLSPQTRSAFRAQRLRLTDLGTDVLLGHKDAFTAAQRDLWLGGVHLQSDKPMWTWDRVAQTLLLRTP